MAILFRSKEEKLFSDRAKAEEQLLSKCEFVCKEFIKSVVMYSELNNHLYKEVEHWMEDAIGNICKEWKGCESNKLPVSYFFYPALKRENLLLINSKKAIYDKVQSKYLTEQTFLNTIKNTILKEKKNGSVKYDAAIKSLSDFNDTEKAYPDLFLYLALVLSVQDLWKSTDHIQKTLVKFYKGQLKIENNINIQTGGKNYPLKYILGTCLKKFMKERFGKENEDFDEYLENLEKEPEVKKIL